MYNRGIPFLNKLIYGLCYFSYKSASSHTILDKAINYATTYMCDDFNAYKQSFLADLSSSASATSFLLNYCGIDFSSLDNGSYIALSDGAIIPRDRIVWSHYMNCPKYMKNTWKKHQLVINLPTLTSSTINVYYKQIVINKLVRFVFPFCLEIVENYINKLFSCSLVESDITVDFSDFTTPSVPCEYSCIFDSSGKLKRTNILFYTYAFIPVDDLESFPALSYFVGNIVLYIFVQHIIMSYLKDASIFYNTSIMRSIGMCIVGYNTLGEQNILNVISSGNLSNIIGDGL